MISSLHAVDCRRMVTMKPVTVLATVTVLLWGQVPNVLGQATVSCHLDPNGEGSQTIPTSVTAECAVHESDKFVFVRVTPETASKRRKKRGGDLPPPEASPIKLLIETSRAYETLDPTVVTSAEPGQDYEHVSFPYVIADGEYGFIVPIIQDDKIEGPELFQVNLYHLIDAYQSTRKKRVAPHPLDPSGDIAPSVNILIIDDDVSFRIDPLVFAIDETSRNLEFKVKRQGKFESSQSVDISTEDITATGGEDYVIEDGRALTFTDAVSDTAEASIKIYSDYKYEGPETFKVMLSSPSDGVIVEPSEAVVIILDSEATVPTSGLFTFNMDRYQVTEGGALEIQICRRGDLDSGATVHLQTNDIEAGSSGDYTEISSQLVSFDAEISKSDPITISTKDDSKVEQQESFELALVSDDATISTATVWIDDDDARYCFDSKVCVVSEDEGAVTVFIVKEGDLQDTSHIRVITANIDASSQSDYTPQDMVVSIPAGESLTQIQIPIMDDQNWEPTECFNVNIEIDGATTCTATVLIKDNDELCDPACVNGKCIGEDTCLCPFGFTGDRCESELCEPACNNGECIGEDTCLCQFGFTGDRCESALCDPACNNGGKCIAPNCCVCSKLYTGPTCEIELCHESCENGGICNEYKNTCRCPSGYTGDRCETSLCSQPCQNGGECIGHGFCVCPSGFSGARCQSSVNMINGMSTSMVAGQISVTHIDDTLAVYNAFLNVEGSAEREALLAKIIPLLNQVLGHLSDILGITVGTISPGSLNIEYAVITPSGSQTNADVVDNAISSTLQQTASASGITINPNPAVTFTRDICPAGYCKNGGTCMADTTDMGSVCTCRGGYTGSQCETQANELSGGEFSGIIIGGIAFIVIIIVAAVCFFGYIRSQGKAITEAPPPNLNTLDLASYPYGYPRVDANGIQNSLML